MTVRIGVDTGGTFTDVCLTDAAGRISVFKLPSTPADPSESIAAGAREILSATGHAAGSVGYLGHGTTVATNALLERRGAPTGVITTAGFRDLLELARQRRPHLYDLQVDKPAPLVARRHRLEVPERLRHDGSVEHELDEEAVRVAVRELRAAGLQAVAICFLYSYLFPEHEQRAAEIVREEFPEAYLSLSHQVLAEFREYERLSTTAVNAYIGPTMSGYVRRLRERVREAGVPVDPYITQSNGGIISLDVAAETPVRTVLSGPAAGVTGALYVATLAGYDNVITFDMGGTSTDVSLIQDGRASMRMEFEVDGLPVRTPMIDINTVGAGGGSVAWIDSGDHLKVGPRSAGAVPGPAAYGRGGTEATVTDANVALGILNRESLLGGRMAVDAAAADAAVACLAERLGLAPVEVAQGILAIVTANMARAIRVISVERGYDPRDYTLLAFGGAGPLHAARLARELDIPRVLVPTVPGILCALGLLVADLRVDFSRTRVLPAAPESLATATTILTDLEGEALAWMEREGLAESGRRLRRVADMRYTGQNYELSIELPAADLDGAALTTVLDAFHAAHDQAYGFASPGEPVQFVTFRLEATSNVPRASLPELPRATSAAEDAITGTRNVYLPEAGGWTPCPVYDRAQLGHGHTVTGPAIIEQMDSTTLILPDQTAEIDRFGNLLIAEGRGLRAEGRAEEFQLGTQNSELPQPFALDPITVEVIGSAFASIVEEMGTALIRASYSTNIKERRDCSTILFDARGRTLAQAEHIPIHLGSLMGMVEEILKRYPLESLDPGDMFIGNDGYTGGGTHLPDIVVVSPVFVQGRIVAFTANLSHHADFVDRGHAHIFQEGLRIPPIKIFDRGELREDVLELILLNTQVPHERRGDLRAQFAANRLGVRRVMALCAKYGATTIEAAGDALLDYAERQTRAGISAVPNGSYTFEDYFDNEQLGDTELLLRVVVNVRGDEIELDFRGNPPQVRAALNMVHTALLATAYYAVKIVVDPHILPNAGMYRPIHVVADPGTIVSCSEPAAIASRTQTCQRVVDLVLGALAQAVPERVIAACTGSNTGITFSGVDQRLGRYYSYLETLGGGFGARATKDGLDGVQTHVTNTSNLPVESLEEEYPLFVERYELVPDSGGPGRWRGGMAIRRDVRVVGHEPVFGGSTSRRLSPPWGLFGGWSGARASITVNGSTEGAFTRGAWLLKPCDVISVVTAGSGGYGDPRERDQALVAADLADGKISAQQARDAYGYVPTEEA
jgi:N-methylhydantoinase A/oxoprolinase/acetone carboxylase beta subunit/N-methylhydantoinase B/oxoprolinase/acetone carboxylase alpha subunit